MIALIALVVLASVGSEGVSAVRQRESLQPAESESADLAERVHWRDPLNCGAACSYVLLRLRGCNASYHDVRRLLAVDETGSSLAAMKGACQKLGFPTEVMRSTPGNLGTFRFPVIAHLYGLEKGQTGHYVVVVGMNEHHVVCFDPNIAALGEVPRGEFFRSWSGHMLVPGNGRGGLSARLILFSLMGMAAIAVVALGVARVRAAYRSKIAERVAGTALILVGTISAMQPWGCSHSMRGEPQPSRSKPAFHLTVWDSERDLGTLSEQEERAATFCIENSGRKEVELELGVPSCSCSSIVIGKTKLLAGETTELHMGLKNKGYAGLFRAHVQIGAKGQQWEQTFSVQGRAIGSHVPRYELVFSDHTRHWVRTIEGHVCALRADDSCEVHGEIIGDSDLKDAVLVDEAEVLEPTSQDGYFMRKVRISIRCLPEKLKRLESSRTGYLSIDVTLCGRRTNHRIAVELHRNARMSREQRESSLFVLQ